MEFKGDIIFIKQKILTSILTPYVLYLLFIGKNFEYIWDTFQNTNIFFHHK